MMKNNKYMYLFSILSLFAFGGLISFVDLPDKSRTISSVEVLEPAESGILCADEMERIEVGDKWQSDKGTQDAIESAFKVCLAEYIKIKTVSPEGNEHKAVEFFEQIFQRFDYPYKKFEVEDLTGVGQTRQNIVATLPHDLSNSYDWSKKQEVESVILLNHMDVVDANESQWESPDLVWSGKIAPSESEPDKNFIWGRGALDMKSIAISELFSMHILRLKGKMLSRDVHFLAVADEEQSGSGAIGAIRKMPEGKELHALTNAALILNEGGGAISGTPNPKWNLFLVAVEEKGGAWMDITHSTPQDLLLDLNRSKILDVKDYLNKKRKERIYTGHGCKIEEIFTPKSKVNVVASKIIITFDCDRTDKDYSDFFEMVFAKKFKSVTVETKAEGRKQIVTIQTGSSSHGSLGINESALDAVAVGFHKMGLVSLKRKVRTPKFFKYVRTKATKVFVKALAKSMFVLQLVKGLQWIPFVKNLVLSSIEDEFGVDGLFKTTCQFSALNYKNNKASALVDCRLIHTAKKFPHSHDHSGEFRKELLSLIKDPDLGIRIMDGWNVSQSDAKSKDFKKLQASLEKLGKETGSNKKVMILPYLFPAGSDSTWFRNPWSAGVSNVEPIPSYGFFPAFITPELLASFHGSNERFPVEQIHGTITRYEAVVDSLTKADKGWIKRFLERRRARREQRDHDRESDDSTKSERPTKAERRDAKKESKDRLRDYNQEMFKPKN